MPRQWSSPDNRYPRRDQYRSPRGRGPPGRSFGTTSPHRPPRQLSSQLDAASSFVRTSSGDYRDEFGRYTKEQLLSLCSETPLPDDLPDDAVVTSADYLPPVNLRPPSPKELVLS